MGGTRPNEGTIQACFQQDRVTVCDDIWFDVNAAVTCRQLGFTQGMERGEGGRDRGCDRECGSQLVK